MQPYTSLRRQTSPKWRLLIAGLLTSAVFITVVAAAYASSTYYVGSSSGSCGRAQPWRYDAAGDDYYSNGHTLSQNRNAMRFCESMANGQINSFNGDNGSESTGTKQKVYGGGSGTLLARDFSTRYVLSGCGGFNTANNNNVLRRCVYDY